MAPPLGWFEIWSPDAILEFGIDKHTIAFWLVLVKSTRVVIDIDSRCLTMGWLVLT